MSTETSKLPQGHYIQANGLEIYYEEYGAGEPLLLLHGGTLTSHSWQAHAPAFAQHFRVIAPDSRGHGRTRNPSDEFSYRLMADDLAAFVQALGLDKPLLCGFSDGAQIALECGMRYPDLAKALIVCGAAHHFSEQYTNVLKGWGVEGPGVIDIAKAQTNIPDLVELWQTVHAPLGGPDYWKTLLCSISTMWWTPMNYTSADFEKIMSPTLILLGDRDEFTPVEEAVEMVRLIPQAELAIFPNANHGETVFGNSGVNPLFMSTVLDFLLRQYPQGKMDSQETPLPHNQRAVMNRFVSACQADARVVAAFLGGSHAGGAADAYSDLDLYLITTDEVYEEFLAGRDAFVRLLGEPLFLEDFGASHGVFFIFADETEGEMWIGRESHFHHLQAGPYRVLLDRRGLLANALFPRHEADPAEQGERLRRLISGFWHELSHFIKAMGRRQLWFAYGQIEAMRHICVNLARLRYDFTDAWLGDEPYFKVEQVLPVKLLSPLETTCCPMEYDAMLQAAQVIVRYYQDTAPKLAKAHGIVYPPKLERMMVNQLLKL